MLPSICASNATNGMQTVLSFINFCGSTTTDYVIPGEMLKTCEHLLRYATGNHKNFNNTEGNEKERRNTHTLTQNLELIYKEAVLKLMNEAPITKNQKNLLQSTTEKNTTLGKLWGKYPISGDL